MTITTRLEVNPKCYILPNNASADAVKDVLFSCAIACTSDNGSLMQYKNLIVTYTNCILNGILLKVPKNHINQHRLTESDLTTLATIRQEIDTITRDPTALIPVGIFARFRCNWDLSRPNESTNGDCRDMGVQMRITNWQHMKLLGMHVV
ncbi:hypothetical protein GcM3_062022 [Golovinomyces cichoracearum]|uniref:Uncharacterized protein n=1 Tax=Golovinomyces cichoracearum TaxID=62708 RepID=A0A420IVU6_9PEZI|nr:hypothetical protein GcM3_062022 [Golovinomyces cichoracearum]